MCMLTTRYRTPKWQSASRSSPRPDASKVWWHISLGGPSNWGAPRNFSKKSVPSAQWNTERVDATLWPNGKTNSEAWGWLSASLPSYSCDSCPCLPSTSYAWDMFVGQPGGRNPRFRGIGENYQHVWLVSHDPRQLCLFHTVICERLSDCKCFSHHLSCRLWYVLKIASKTLRRDMYNLQDPGSTVNVPDPDPLGSIRYSCVFWVDHLCKADDQSLNHGKELSGNGAVCHFERAFPPLAWEFELYTQDFECSTVDQKAST